MKNGKNLNGSDRMTGIDGSWFKPFTLHSVLIHVNTNWTRGGQTLSDRSCRNTTPTSSLVHLLGIRAESSQPWKRKVKIRLGLPLIILKIINHKQLTQGGQPTGWKTRNRLSGPKSNPTLYTSCLTVDTRDDRSNTTEVTWEDNSF